MNNISPRKILISAMLMLILTCCASSSNSRISNFYIEETPNKISKNLLKDISSSSQKYNFYIYYQNSQSKNISNFLEGIKSAFFFQKSIKSVNKKVNFIEINESKNICNKINFIEGKKIIINSDLYKSIIANCANILDNNFLLIDLEENQNLLFKENIISLKTQNYLNQLSLNEDFNFNKFIFISKNISELEKFNSAFPNVDQKTRDKSFILIRSDKNFENQIASIFEITKSQSRKRNLQSTLGRDLKMTPRYRKDITSVIVSSSSNIAKRIVPAFKYNLLFGIQIYNLPNHFDSWNQTASFDDLEDTQGLEYPILLNKVNLGAVNFYKYSPEEKIYYSLGFDLINSINFGNGYFGLLGNYYYDGQTITIRPLKVSFKAGKVVQELN
tara:strand:+ start:17952 stop:19112 length:1161 start_codon:yes stop_codon:yes gene_type:complete